jgi:pyruvate ferredoxin oxidoreductase beta subunit
MLAKDLTEKEYLYGHKACPGCSLGIVGRLTMKVLGEKTVVTLPASCMSTVTTQYPQMNYSTPSLTMAFPASGSLVSGMAAGFKARGITDVNVVTFSGDGGTADIGLQSLSGAVEQGENFIYICYDNEAYMNTGIQCSGLTPIGAATTTTPAGKYSYGETKIKKNMFEIMVAHRIPYCATCSTSYVNDLVTKVEKAKNIKGPAFLHIMSPCPTGWGFPSSKTIEIGRMAVECGMWSLMEYENGKITVNKFADDPKPVDDYLMAQRRFRHLKPEEIRIITQHRDAELEVIRSWAKKQA